MVGVAIKCGPAAKKVFKKQKKEKKIEGQKKFENRSDKMGHSEQKKKFFCT